LKEVVETGLTNPLTEIKILSIPRCDYFIVISSASEKSECVIEMSLFARHDMLCNHLNAAQDKKYRIEDSNDAVSLGDIGQTGLGAGKSKA
jgi:hypothetical protein